MSKTSPSAMEKPVLTQKETQAAILAGMDGRLWQTANDDYQLRLYSRFEVEAVRAALSTPSHVATSGADEILALLKAHGKAGKHPLETLRAVKDLCEQAPRPTERTSDEDYLLVVNTLDRITTDDAKFGDQLVRAKLAAGRLAKPSTQRTSGKRVEELVAYHAEDCVRLKGRDCTTLRCLKRGGYKPGAERQFDPAIATCEAYETVQILRSAPSAMENKSS